MREGERRIDGIWGKERIREEESGGEKGNDEEERGEKAGGKGEREGIGQEGQWGRRKGVREEGREGEGKDMDGSNYYLLFVCCIKMHIDVIAPAFITSDFQRMFLSFCAHDAFCHRVII